MSRHRGIVQCKSSKEEKSKKKVIPEDGKRASLYKEAALGGVAKKNTKMRPGAKGTQQASAERI